MLDEKPTCPFCADNHGSAFICGELALRKIILTEEVIALRSNINKGNQMLVDLNFKRIFEMISYLNNE